MPDPALDVVECIATALKPYMVVLPEAGTAARDVVGALNEQGMVVVSRRALAEAGLFLPPDNPYTAMLSAIPKQE